MQDNKSVRGADGRPWGVVDAPGDAANTPLRAYPGFVRLWWTRIFGVAAAQMLMVALGWQMYETTGSAWDLGLVGLLQFLPALLLALPAGQLVDRYPRGLILALALGAQALCAVGLAVGSEWGMQRSWLLGASLLLGAVRAFQLPAQQALLPQLVPPAVLPRALASSAAALQAAVIAGPALGGLAYALGASVTYALCAALMVAGWVLVWPLGRQQGPASKAPMTREALMAGVRYVWRQPVVLGAMSLDLMAVLFGGATALLPIFAKDILHTGPLGLGLLRSAPAIGALGMSLWLSRRPIQRRAGRVLLVAVGVYGLSMVAFGTCTAVVPAMLALAVSGAADMISVVIRSTLVQLETPDDMRGRVSAVNGVFIGASNQLGEFESGVTAAWWGPVASVVVGGAVTVAVAVAWVRLFPALAQRDRLVRAGQD